MYSNIPKYEELKKWVENENEENKINKGKKTYSFGY
jgi:hypothetical protein